MSTFKQIFVCATPGTGCCGEKGGARLLGDFRQAVESRGLDASVIQRQPCSRRHHEGPVVFVFPDDVWYTEVTSGDVPGILDRHLPSDSG